MSVAIHPDDIERQRGDRTFRLAVIEIPLLRIFGSALLVFAVYLNNRFLIEGASPTAWIDVAALLGAYCLFSWILLAVFYRRLMPLDIGMVFLAADLVIWTVAIYESGAERSWLFFVLLMRIADQTHTTFRRCLTFVLLSAVCYAAMLQWVVYVDERNVAPEIAVTKLAFVVLSGLYIAFTARTAESRRVQLTNTVRISRDLIRRLEEQSVELHDARLRAEEANAAKSEFLANMSHEMRTPLHGLIGMLQLAADGESSPQHQRRLRMARQSAEALLATIDHLLDFAKIEARKLVLEPTDFQIRDWMAETMKPLGVTAAGKGLTLSYRVDADVPDSVRADAMRMRQIVVNLVGNAIKFTASGEVAVFVSLSSSDERDALIRFAVRDTGIGIDPAQRKSIFEPFTQADTSHSRRFGGTGLGLAIVKQLVAGMGGEIDVISDQGQGTTFTFTVKLRVRQPSAAMRRIWETSLEGVSVLLIEPAPIARGILAQILLSRGMAVTERASVADAPRSRFSCVVTADENAIARGEPGVLISSPLDPHDSDETIRVTRPVTERELIDALGVALGVAGREPRALASPVAADVTVTEANTIDPEDTIGAAEPAPPPPPTAPPPPPPPVAAQPARPAAARPQQKTLRVLVAEDNPVSQEFAAEALRSLGHDVMVASDGEEALAAMTRDEFDLVLMDVQMPLMDGLEATQRFRELEQSRGAVRHTPIFALTAHTRREDHDRCLASGMDGVMTKPIRRESLAEVTGAISRAANSIMTAVDGDRALLVRVSEAFTKQTPTLVSAMREAVEKGDSESLARTAHTIKGTVSYFTGEPAIGMATEIEAAAREGDLARAAAILPQLEAALQSLGERLAAIAKS